jgi:hypothetical protein
LQANRILRIVGIDEREVIGWNGELILTLESPYRFEFFGRKGEKISELPNRADSILGLPPPIVPLVIGNAAPEWMAPRLTGRLFVFDSIRGPVDHRPVLEPAGSRFRFVHRVGCLQKDIDIQYSPPAGSGP